jgi:malonate transporter and related proteins
LPAILDLILPIFGFIVLGYALGRSPILGGDSAKGLSQFVFYCAIPALLFRAGSRVFGTEALSANLLIAFYSAGVGLHLGLSLWLWRVRGRPLAEAALAGMTSVFTNTVMLGLPLAQALYGDRGLLLASSVIAINGMLYYSLTTTLIELGRGEGGSAWRQVLGGLKGLTRNPILIAMAAGLGWGALGWSIPGPAARMIDLLAAAAAPVALVSLGATLSQFKLAGDLVEAGWLTALKLAAYPALAGGIGHFILGMEGDMLAITILLAALPCGVNPFLLARRYDIYVQRCGSAILLTTVFGILTLSLLIAVLAPNTP